MTSDADQYVSTPTPTPRADECFCDQRGLGVKGASCGDCPRDYARADAARPVPADVLAKCARLLGGTDLYGFEAEDGREWRMTVDDHYKFFSSDGDLLLAILNKAAEMELDIKLRTNAFQGLRRNWRAELAAYRWDGNGDRVKVGEADAAVEAALLAFAQLEPPHDR